MIETSDGQAIDYEDLDGSSIVPLLRADPHRWGNGAVHLIDIERDKVLCGKTPRSCPGTRFDGVAALITCKVCLRSIEANADYERLRRRYADEAAARALVHEENQRFWWARYNNYLLSQTWNDKRALVLRRAAGVCEGCGARQAVQVHHLIYPQNCAPGSDEWIAREKLFDLRAVCLVCHQDVHGRRT